MIPSLATGLKKDGENWEVTTESGDTVTGKKVVLAQGTYTAINSLLASLLPPFDLTHTAQTTALLEVTNSNIKLGFKLFQVDKEEAARLSAMPSMVIQVCS